MADAKIEISIGAIEFTGEGTEKWVEAQLDKILDKAPELLKLAPSHVAGRDPIGPDPSIATKALGVFLAEKNATTNQVRKFLATAVWLESKGTSRLKTNDVARALRDNSQKKLSNASQSLIENVKKGQCERDGEQFFVTEEGKKTL